MTPGELVADKYRLEKRIGVGGMGEVWSALHAHTGRRFAIKFMHAQVAKSASARHRFAREARASARVDHPNVIDVFDVGEHTGGSLYLVMELLDGLALDDALHAEPPLSVADLVSVLCDTTEALAAAHAAGIVHRDLKPANIFLHKDRGTSLSYAKILDFGISKFSVSEDSLETQSGSMLGSPRYMSPEQARSAANADHRADVWAIGVILFEGLTGTWPHDGDSFSSLVIAIATSPPRSIDQHAPHLPEPLRAIVRECLRPVAERVITSGDIAAGLAALISDPLLSTLPLPRPTHSTGATTRSTTGLRFRRSSVSVSTGRGAASPAPKPSAQAPSPGTQSGRWPSSALDNDDGEIEPTALLMSSGGVTGGASTFAHAKGGGITGGSTTGERSPSTAPFPPGSTDGRVATMDAATVALVDSSSLLANPFSPAPSRPASATLRIAVVALGVAAVGLGVTVFLTLRSGPPAPEASVEDSAPARPGAPEPISAPEPVPAVPDAAPDPVPSVSASARPAPTAPAPAQTTTAHPTVAPRPKPPPRPPASKLQDLGSGL